MNAPAAAKWLDGVHHDTPCVVAARRALGRRLKAVERLLPLADRHGAGHPEYVHQLRVATRRAAAALRVFREFCPETSRRRLSRALRVVRRAAAAARQNDVQVARLRDYLGLGPIAAPLAEAAASLQRAASASPIESAHTNGWTDDPQPRNGAPRGEPCDRFSEPNLAPGEENSRSLTPAEWLLSRVQADAGSARSELHAAAHPDRIARLRRLRKRLLAGIRSLRPPGSAAFDPEPYTLAEQAACVLPPLLTDLERTGRTELGEMSALHALRLAGKRLRYTLELLACCLGGDVRDTIYPHLSQIQEQLGEINDLHELAGVLQQIEASTPRRRRGRPGAAAPLRWLAAQRIELEQRRDGIRARFLNEWESPATREVLAELGQRVAELNRDEPARPLPPAELHHEDAPPAVRPPRRVAAIDVGTNSLRLVVAESDPSSRFRVIEDVRETTRLGAGLYSTGRLHDEAVELSLQMLERMRGILRSAGVERVRAVGTSALREAQNGPEFIEAARCRAGLNIEVIEADYEARLAFASVANAFDLDDLRVAAVDLGGGSTEVVLSSEGLIDAVHKLPLGAVRLTEMFGSADKPGEYRFGEMRRAVDRLIDDALGESPWTPDLLIGTGGTFTALAKMSIRRGALPHREGRFPFALRGYEMPRSEVSDLLEWLRRTPLDQRRRIPGLGERRAEIVVAGICVIDRLMDRFGVERLRVHDGGIRDGLLMELFDELGVGDCRTPDATREALSAVRAFARRAEYPKEHSEHVARLALRIYDQLAAQSPAGAPGWARRDAREVLQFGSLLHDVGLLVGLPRHHRHGADMIAHASLGPLKRHERTLIAALARYHRRRGPRASDRLIRRLGDDDRRLVAHLVGILRIADGLDRLHRQSVTDVVVHAEPREVRFEVRATENPAVEIEFARRKADVFESAFRARATFVWEPTRTRRTSEPLRA